MAFEEMFNVADEGPAVTQHLIQLLEQIPCGGKQVHDANVVASMLAMGIPRLLTANPTDFLRFSPVITVTPLAG